MEWLILLIAFMPNGVMVVERYPNDYVCRASLALYERASGQATCIDLREIKNAGAAQ